MDVEPPPLPADPKARPPVHPARGWLLVVLGPCLSMGMAFLANWLYQATLHNDDPGSHGRWHGSAEFTRTVFGLFGSVFVFGLVATAAGIYIVRTRRISRVIFGIMLAVVLVMIYFGYTIITTPTQR